MYAVICTGGKQYRVAAGDRLRVEKLNNAVGDTIELSEVRLVVNEEGIVVDPSALESAKVLAEVTDQGKSKKIRVYKKKRRKNYVRTYGHRQLYTELRIREIQA